LAGAAARRVRREQRAVRLAGRQRPGSSARSSSCRSAFSCRFVRWSANDDTITLDVQPLVVTPDSVLTDTIRQSTGAAVATTAFQTRALRTSSRLQDGQALLIGGLLSNNTSSNTASTPGLRSIPFIAGCSRGSIATIRTPS